MTRKTQVVNVFERFLTSPRRNMGDQKIVIKLFFSKEYIKEFGFEGQKV